ncbi:MAG: diaminopimelate epimerase [Planctomycetota bacterium]|nr:diaminopimelate epimerase [Planctomycetota bacterium]
MTVWLSGQRPKGLDGGTESLFWVDGTGNRFVLVDALDSDRADHWEAAGSDWARGFVGGGGHWVNEAGQIPDGLVLLLPPKGRGQVRMALFNVDGSRPEACGNALRCLTRVVFDGGRVDKPQFVVETDAGDRPVDAFNGGARQSRVSMGAPRLIAGALNLEVCGRSVRGVSISMGNPHFVIEPNTVKDSEVEELGAALSVHPSFPDGTNVEFVFGRVDQPRVRVWERGVGETEACGSGACAVAHMLFGTALIRQELTLGLPGGELVVGRDTHGLWLQGAARWDSLELQAQGATQTESDC